MPAKYAVVLQYARVEGMLSSGRLFLAPDNSGGALQWTPLEEFEKLSFSKMFTRLAHHLREQPEAAAVVYRNDRPGLIPYVLDPEVTALLRQDPVAAIHSLTYAPPPVAPPRERTAVPPASVPLEASPLRAGEDTLADAFGDEVYTPLRAGAIECPGCGRWGKISDEAGSPTFVCWRDCRKDDQVGGYPVTPGGRWAAVAVRRLLATPSTRFWLPRAWNPSGPWISRDSLRDMYAAYQAEKATLCSEKTTAR